MLPSLSQIIAAIWTGAALFQYLSVVSVSNTQSLLKFLISIYSPISLLSLDLQLSWLLTEPRG